MKKISLFSSLFSLVTVCFIFGTSCSSSRFYKDYEYTPREKAPDMGNQVSTPIKEQSSVQQNTVLTLSPDQTIQGEHAQVAITEDTENKNKIDKVVRAFKEEMVAAGNNNDQVSNKEIMEKVSKKLTEEGQINPLTRQQEKKLDKMASKMDKKLKKEGKDIDWRHNTPLELFFMIMSIAGLVLGIVGVTFGWFVFIVFGGLWLYFKLVEDKK